MNRLDVIVKSVEGMTWHEQCDLFERLVLCLLRERHDPEALERAVARCVELWRDERA